MVPGTIYRTSKLHALKLFVINSQVMHDSIVHSVQSCIVVVWGILNCCCALNLFIFVQNKIVSVIIDLQRGCDPSVCQCSHPRHLELMVLFQL